MFRRRKLSRAARRARRPAGTSAKRRPIQLEVLEDRYMFSASAIVAENALPGTPQSVWDVPNPSANIQGYAAQFSVNRGQTVEFKVDTDASAYHLSIYRIGYYQGNGARLITTINPDAALAQNQPNARYDLTTNTADASNWRVSASWAVPTTAVSGVYVADLVRDDGGSGANQIIFVVRDDTGNSDLLFQTSDTTWQAYNAWGGSSLYTPNYPAGRAVAVSYARPFANRVTNPINFFFADEYPMIRFLEQNGYDVSYTSGQRVAQTSGSEILSHKVFVSVGHDEYWSAEQFDGVMAARDAGVNLAFFSGNAIFWKTRWVADDAGNPYGTMVSYKETLSNAITDPMPGVWTGTWADPRFSPPKDGGRPQNALTGTLFTINGLSNSDYSASTSMKLTSQYAALRFWRNTTVATLTGNSTLSIGDNVLGYEADSDVDNGFRPAGLFDLSATSVNASQALYDYGGTFGPATVTQNMTLYRAGSGALVFSAGTVQYSWALDNRHDIYYNGATDKNLQQATVNLFADMGAQPGSLMASLIRATMSTDALAPVSTITSPLPGATVQAGATVTIRGTSQDQGGGVIAAVEVSVDGGITWHPASGTTSWTYTFAPRTGGQFTIISRAVDDNGNLEKNGPRVTVNPPQAAGTYNLFGSIVPGTIDGGDGAAIEVGMRFKSDVDALVTGIRFYKSVANTGTHVGHLWNASGVLLATAFFTGETASGWQQVNLATPVYIQANTVYIVSYYAPKGRYSADRNYFVSQGIDNGPLHGLSQGPSGPDGVFVYGNSAFPTNTYQSSNYYVDVVINTAIVSDTMRPKIISYAAADGSSVLTTDSSIIIKFSEALNAASVNSTSVQLLNPDLTSIPPGCCGTPGGWCTGCPLLQAASTRVINATVVYDAVNYTVTLTPTAPLSTLQTYTVFLKSGSQGVYDVAGNSLAADSGASFLTPSQPASTRSTIWPTSATPATVDVGEAKAVELGTKFYADTSGTIAGIEFYKSAANTGVHTGSLWSATGQLLATGTFTGETASGWQQLTFTTPVAVTAGTTYVASYHTDSGRFSVDKNYFTSQFNSGLLHVPADGGVYLYGTGGFPTQTNLSSNYWVQPILRTPITTDNTAPTILSISPAAGTTGVSVTPTITAQFSEALDPTTVSTNTLRLMDNSNQLVPTSVTYNEQTFMATIVPTSALSFGGMYTIVVAGGAQGIRDMAGNPVALTTGSSFTTVGAPVPDTTPPMVIAVNPANNATGYAVNGAITVTFSEPLNAASVNAASVILLKNALSRIVTTVTYNAASNSITITPTAPLEYGSNYTVYLVGGVTGIRDLSDNAMTPNYSSSFTTVAAPPPASLWSTSTTPGTVDGGDTQSIEVGVKFTADSNGYIIGVRFYKSAANTGTHVGNLWSASGQLLATGTYSGETASGWQTLTFATPVAITAGTTYTASYLAPKGRYAADTNFFNAQFNSGPLHVPASGGVYRYGATSGFPTSTFSKNNYWVDVLFSLTPPADTTPPTVTAMSPANGATNVPTNVAATVRFSEAINTTSLSSSTLQILDGTTLVPATITYDANTNTATIAPVSPLANSRTYTLSATGGIPGLKDTSGNNLAQTTSTTFTTAAVDVTAPTVTSFNPTNNASSVATSATVTVTFSEAVDPTTVNATTVSLLTNTNAVMAATVSYNPATSTATLTPTSPLANSASYTIVVQGGVAGVHDLAGNALAANATSAFQTVASSNGGGGGGTGGTTSSSTSLWTTTTPATADVGEPQSLELGVKFTSNANGYITGLRFYKSTANTGTHVGHLWTSSGQLLATATFTGETASGWQQVTFATPVAITAGTTYVASYFAPNGHFAVNRSYFKSAFTSGQLQVPANGGVFMYGAASAFPTQTYGSSNYWVDVMLSTAPPVDTTAPTVTGFSPAGGATNVAVSTPITITFSEALSAASVTTSTVRLLDGATQVAATVAYNAGNNTVTITPTAALANSKAYTISVLGGASGVKDAAGNALAQTATSTFTTVAAPPVDTTAPTVTGFSPAGGATSVAVNTAITVTFSEALSAASVTTSTVRLLDGSTQVAATVAYNAANNTVTVTPTAALANSKAYTISVLGGASGVKDAAGNALAQTATSTFTTVAATPPDTTPPTVTGFSPASGATNVAINTAVTVTFSEALSAASVTTSTVRLLDGATQVAASASYNATNKTVTITPTAALANSKVYTISVVGGSAGVKDAAGNALAQTATSTFTTVAAPVTTSSLWSASTTPKTVDVGEPQAIELGVKFTADVNGYITGIRFYKSSANTGTHIGNLWSSTGQLLATATFTNETASGWQQVTFSTPVAVTAGTTYVASYYAPNGRFSVNRNYFGSAFTSGLLRVPASGGVFKYGSSSAFPDQTFNASNYWVDVVFSS
ncbi:MAG: DUF4082 domain-containing protein [Planctomycetia bacterium]|nr:DUF4082 domain-containing protein [Planctomycetia bacterium]